MIIFLLSLFLSSAEAASPYTCETTYDQMNIPHVKTTSLDGFYYCFGLHHGQDRAWEMDFFRRVGEGRNAEVLGFSQLKSDLMMRLLDLPALADKLWNEFPPEKKKWLEVYAEGVNEGFKTGKNSKEFKTENFEPEPWQPKHSLLVLLLQSFDQTRKTFFRDYEEEKLKEKWGKETEELFDDDNMPWENTILKEGEYPTSKSVVSVEYNQRPFKLWGDFPFIFGKESGSNNWVVSKAKSKNGHAMLANDPHLDLKTPMFWYWINIKTPEFSVMGGSVPGAPIVASGTNGKVAWGLTNSYLNSADTIFVKDIKPEQIETVRPTVKIKLWFMQIPFFFKTFEKLKETGHRILPLDIETDHKMVLRWTGFTLKPEEFYPMFDLFKMNNVTEMNELISRIGIPSWNFVFADAKGDIGYRLVGRTYKHTQKFPMGIPEMTLKDFLKEDYLTPEERPHVLKPKRNYVYSANNRHWPSDAKFYGGRGYSYSFRGLRIDELLQDDQDVESFKKIQCDTQVVDGRFFLPKIQKYLNAPELKDWNLTSEDSSKALPVYRRLLDLVFEKWEVNEYALFKMLDQLTPEQEKEFKNLYQHAVAEVKGRDWGQIHVVNFPHMAKQDNWKFSPEIPGVGDTHSINPGTAKWNADRNVYEQNSGASMRMIIELKETPTVWLALPGLNRHYDNKKDNTPWESWKKCEYTQVQF